MSEAEQQAQETREQLAAIREREACELARMARQARQLAGSGYNYRDNCLPSRHLLWQGWPNSKNQPQHCLTASKKPFSPKHIFSHLAATYRNYRL